MGEYESKKRWDRENTVSVGVRLMRKADADLIEAISEKKSKAAELKRLARLGLEREAENRPDTA